MTKCYECGVEILNSDNESYRGMALCAECKKYHSMRDAYDAMGLELIRLEKRDPDAALALLDQFWGSHEHLDRNRWLDHSIRSDKAFVLWRHGRNEEALVVLRALSCEFNERRSNLAENEYFVNNQIAIAVSLKALGRHEEALQELHKAINEPVSPRTLTALMMYADIAESIGQPVPSSYLGVIAVVAEDWGIALPMRSSEPADVAHLIRFLDSEERAGHARYKAFMRLVSSDSSSDLRESIAEFLSKESVGRYRKLVCAQFGDSTRTEQQSPR